MNEIVKSKNTNRSSCISNRACRPFRRSSTRLVQSVYEVALLR